MTEVPRRDLSPADLPARLSLRVMPDETGCWIWIGAKNANGYGIGQVLRPDGRRSTTTIHRVVYEALVGPIPTGLVVDHSCNVRPCVNPDHLEAVTQRENLQRSTASALAINARKTHCIRGHPLAGANLYVPPSTTNRQCLTCRRVAAKAWWAARSKQPDCGAA